MKAESFKEFWDCIKYNTSIKTHDYGIMELAWDAALQSRGEQHANNTARDEICTCDVLEYNHNRTLVTLIVSSGCPVHDVQTSPVA